jgi:oligo-1,6-glucosidase
MTIHSLSTVSLTLECKGRLHSAPWHERSTFTLPDMKAALARPQDSYISHPLAWASVFKENHDLPRSVPRFGTKNPEYHFAAAKLLAMMNATLSGTLFVYQGEEIGMSNIPESWGIEDCKDINTMGYWRKMEERFGKDKEMMRKVWLGIVDCSRDNARTPVQWSGEKHGGCEYMS